MANYYIDIIDTTDDTHVTVLEKAKKNSIVLSYEGKDQKDELVIVGSSLRFSMAVPYNGTETDAAFIDLFTGDEQKYRVELRKEDDDALLFQFFLLPDSYKEPYQKGTFFVDFEAVDGLGRLKGKFLPDEFYTGEYSVIQFITECLKLTGLNMNLYFTPAISPSNNQAWHTIYIDGGVFVNRNRNDDAYKILESLAKDMLCCVFQHMGNWHFEGLNKRNLTNYTVKEYDTSGDYIQDLELTRNVKVISGSTLTTPIITMIPPYSLITVTHERVSAFFKETLSKELNDGWVVTTGVNPVIYATDWVGHNNFYALAKAPNYEVYLVNNETDSIDTSLYISLKNKIYLSRSEKYTISFKARIEDTLYNQEQSVVTTWYDPVNYDVMFNDTIVFSNRSISGVDNYRLDFINSKIAEVSFEFIAPENGLLDFKIFQPYKDDEQIVAVLISELKLERIAFVDEEIFTDEINADYTLQKEIELDFADDPSGFSKSFRLQKLNENAETYNEIEITPLYSFTQSGNHYSAVSLQHANLIADNIDSVTASTGSIEVYEVIYNFLEQEQMLVRHNLSAFAGNFIVRIYYKSHGDSNRSAWLKWTDSVYEVEQRRYAECVANVMRRMFTVPHQKIDLDVTKIPVAFTDIVRWNYKQIGNYFVTNLSWNLDNGITTLSLNKAIYQNDDTISPGENIPPFVDAGEDIYITNSQTNAALTSVSNDPDGFIASWFWEQETSEIANIVSPAAADTSLSGLLADFFTFKITVTDNDGATASDTVNVIRIRDYLIQFNEILNSDTVDSGDQGEIINKHYEITCTPSLPDGMNLSIDAQYVFILQCDDPADETTIGQVIIEKNSVEIVNDEKSLRDLELNQYTQGTNVPFAYNNTDSIVIKLKASAFFTAPDGSFSSADVFFYINNISFVSGNGNITTTLPVTLAANADAP